MATAPCKLRSAAVCLEESHKVQAPTLASALFLALASGQSAEWRRFCWGFSGLLTGLLGASSSESLEGRARTGACSMLPCHDDEVAIKVPLRGPPGLFHRRRLWQGSGDLPVTGCHLHS